MAQEVRTALNDLTDRHVPAVGIRLGTEPYMQVLAHAQDDLGFQLDDLTTAMKDVSLRICL